MIKKKTKNVLTKRLQNEMVFTEIKNNTDKKKNPWCNDFATRSCLNCNTCWVKK